MKRVMARVARATAMAMRVAGDEEGNGKGGKVSSNGNEDGEKQRVQWQGQKKQWQRQSG